MAEKQKKLKGFAVMRPEKQREIAVKGGQAAHAGGGAHEWTPLTAAEAGRKGGLSKQRRWRERNGVTEPSA